MIGRHLQTGAFQSAHDAPERATRVQRRGGLHHGQAARGQMPFQQAIEHRAVQLAEGVVGRVGEIDHDEVEGVGVLFQPGKGVGVDHPDLG